MKENSLNGKKTRNRQYPAENITDADFADDLVLLVNTLAQSEYRLHNPEPAARSIDSNITEFMYFKYDDLHTLNNKPL